MDEPPEKSVIHSDSKEKIGNTINQLDLLYRLFTSSTPPPATIVSRGLVGTVRGPRSPPMCLCGYVPIQFRRGNIQTTR